MLTLCNWFFFYCLPRTYANCLETTLILAAFVCWPASDALARTAFVALPAIALVACACLVRPTAVVYVAPLPLFAAFDLWRRRTRSSSSTLSAFLFICVAMGALALGISVVIDSVSYDRIANDDAVQRILSRTATASAVTAASKNFVWRSSLLNFLEVTQCISKFVCLNTTDLIFVQQ